jgi:murein tripeptide amidase MpaA
MPGRYRVTIHGRDYDAMADLVRRYRVSVVRQTARAIDTGGFTVQAHVSEEQIAILEDAGYAVDRHEDAERSGRERQAELRGAAATRARPAEAPARYLAVDQVEEAVAALAGPPNDGFVLRLQLPHPTWESRVASAIKIGTVGASRVGIYLLGGVHAREWGSPDILLHFARELLRAYRTGAGITIGTKEFSADQIREVVETKDVFVFPQANPDGRLHSMTVDADWRKNRRPAAPGSRPACTGVDLNRNYDFLWDYRRHFAADAPVSCSTDPCDGEVYVGPAPASEPETRNVVWLFDQMPNIRYFVDLHSYGEMILYSWGDDEDQTTDPAMTFRNGAYDGTRGRAGDRAYREFIDPTDRETALSLARGMQAAIEAVRGHRYTVQQSMSLYPTSGTSDDYAYSRHLVTPEHAKVLSFTIEWGSDANPSPFHPPYPEMRRIMDEVTAGLLELCCRASA